MAEFHGSLVVVDRGIDTSHHTLVITEEEDGQAGNTIDGDEKTTLLQLMDDIGPRDSVHGGDNSVWSF